MEKRLKTSVTLRENHLAFARDVAETCDCSVSDVVNKSLEQLQALVEADESAANLAPYTRFYRQMMRGKSRRQK